MTKCPHNVIYSNSVFQCMLTSAAFFQFAWKCTHLFFHWMYLCLGDTIFFSMWITEQYSSFEALNGWSYYYWCSFLPVMLTVYSTTLDFKWNNDYEVKKKSFFFFKCRLQVSHINPCVHSVSILIGNVHIILVNLALKVYVIHQQMLLFLLSGFCWVRFSLLTLFISHVFLLTDFASMCFCSVFGSAWAVKFSLLQHSSCIEMGNSAPCMFPRWGLYQRSQIQIAWGPLARWSPLRKRGRQIKEGMEK